MEIRNLSRDDLMASMRNVRNQRPELGQQVERDLALVGVTPGNSFGDMVDNTERSILKEKRLGSAWFGGQAALTVGGGYMALAGITGTHSILPAMGLSPVAGVVVGFACLGVAMYCHNQVHEHRAAEGRAVDRYSRLSSWQFVLREADLKAAENDARSTVERLADGLKDVQTSILLDDKSVQVGGVRLKRKS